MDRGSWGANPSSSPRAVAVVAAYAASYLLSALLHSTSQSRPNLA
ncbi:hypothetical protein OG946_24400 [Streptomyces sp. NBC_01808]|nr:hypothetical protein [Streptomyces sp. NBC_01808]WSA40231.1 hypothetical protein OG946_24400 [Streptomyces sp. NBC_01808]